MSKKLLFKGGHATGMTPYEIEDFSSLHIRDPRIDEKTKAYIDSVIGNSVLNLCPYRNVLVTHKYDTVEGNVVTLDDCQDDEIIQLSEIQGNTLVNCNKDTDKELILNGNIDTSGYTTVTTTEGVDGGKVDVALEGNTMVNVCNQEEPVAITKSYEVTTGNHVALQGEYDGKCRPNVYGNTMVNLAGNSNVWDVGCSGKRGTDYTITSTDANGIVVNKLTDNVTYFYFFKKIDPNLFKPNTTYTLIFNCLNAYRVGLVSDDTSQSLLPLVDFNNEYNVIKITSTDLTSITGEKPIYVYIRVKNAYIGTAKASNVIVLEGDYTNKPIPDYFTGMKSSFEDKLVPENLASDVLYNGVINKQYTNLSRVSTSKLKRNTKYTTFIKNDSEESIKVYSDNTGGNFRYEQITIPAKSSKVTTIITKDEELSATKNTWLSLDSNETLPQNISAYLVEGDYTNYDFTNYDSTKVGKYKVDYKVTGKNKFNGKLEYGLWKFNSLEKGNASNLVRMSELCECKPNTTYILSGSAITTYGGNLAFYDKDMKYLGDKNQIFGFNNFTTPSNAYYFVFHLQNTFVSNIEGTFQIEEGTTATDYEPYKEYTKTLYLNSPLLEGDTIEQSGNNIIHNHRYTSVVFDGTQQISYLSNLNKDNTVFFHYPTKSGYPKDIVYCNKLSHNVDLDVNDVEGIRTNNAIQFRLNKNKFSSTDYQSEITTYLKQNPITVVYKLAQPTQEIISTNDNLLLDSYTNGHLDIDTVVPIDKVAFNSFKLKLKYLYPNTDYVVQFESDNEGVTHLYCNTNITGNNPISVKKGINKTYFTTPETIQWKVFDFNGIGFNASKIVVTPKVDNDFGYFKGMKSVGECEGNKIEILSQNKNLLPILNLEVDNEGYANRQKTYWQNVKLKPNTKYTLSYINKTINNTNSDMWAVWVREQVGKKAVTTDNIVASTQTEISTSFTTSDKDLYEVSIISNNGDDVGSYLFKPNTVILEEGEKTSYVPYAMNKKEILLNEPLRGLPNGVKDKYVIIDGKWYIERNCGIRVYEEGDIDNYKTDLVNTVYPLAQPTYEPIEYNPFEVYTDTTHISNNSNIPCNMVIRNSGFNCILKPNTTYTVSSNNGLSTVTTKDSIGDSVLRFYNKDTSKITKINNVLVLEGDYITGNPPIPTFFEGMESAFEQELVTDKNDEHYGKYKVNVKAINKNLFPKDITILENKVWYTDDCSLITVNGYNCINKIIKVLPNTNYSLCCNGKHCEGNIWFYDKDKKPISQVFISPFKTPLNTMYISYHGGSLSCPVGAKLMLTLGNQVEDYIPQEQNNITFYINEPLRGVGDVKDKVYVKEDKVVVERNCSSVTFDGSEDESWQAPSNANYKYGVFTLHLPLNHKDVKMNDKNEHGALCNTLIPYWWWTQNDSFETVPDNSIHYLTWENTNTFYIIKKNLRTVDEIKQWLKSNKTKYIYPLKTSTYEEVECDLFKLALEGYNHGTLFYNSNTPVTTQFYDFNVNVKDILIPNETYYVTFIADRVKDITINLSGVQVNYKTSMGYNKVPVQLGDVVNTNFSMDSRGVELSDLMISTSTSLIYVKDMNDVCVYDEASNKYSITITSTGGNESDKRVILLDYPLLRLNKDIYDRLYYNNKDSRYRMDKKVFKHKFTNDREYSKYTAETNDTYYSSFISLNETIKDYVIITNEKVKTVKVENDKYYFKIKWSDLGVSDKTEVNGNQGMKDFFNNNEVYLYYATDGFVEIVDELRRQTLKMYQPETTINFLGNTTTTVTIVIPKKNI